MARTGKLTIYVETGAHTQTLSVRTTGKMGTTALNTVSLDLPYNYRTAAPDALTFWSAIVTLVAAAL